MSLRAWSAGGGEACHKVPASPSTERLVDESAGVLRRTIHAAAQIASSLALLAMTCNVCYADFGRVETKRERAKKEAMLRGGYWQKEAPDAFEAVQEGFLRQDYALTIRRAKEYLKTQSSSAQAVEAMHLEGLSLMKLGQGEEARRTFREAEARAASAGKKAELRTSIADSYYFENKTAFAYQDYSEVLTRYPGSGEEPYVVSRLAELSPKASLVPASENQGFFAVQVGSFSKERNARALANKLQRRHYEAYIEKTDQMCRVRVGRLASRQEADMLESRLRKEGYPTKVVP